MGDSITRGFDEKRARAELEATKNCSCHCCRDLRDRSEMIRLLNKWLDWYEAENWSASSSAPAAETKKHLGIARPALWDGFVEGR